MSPSLKKIEQQVIVVTDATNQVGSCFALLASQKGAKLVLASANENDLRELVSQIRQNGRDAVFLVVNISEIDDVDQIFQRAISEFGRVDSWVNCANYLLPTKLLTTSIEEKRKIFEFNFWGIVYGCRAALKELKKRGGAIVNIGIVSADKSISHQGLYAASKHAVKTYTDALRMEVESEKFPVSISLINSLGHESEIVAQSILECCETPKKDVFIGGSSKLYSVMETFVPRLTDYLMERIMTDPSEQSPENDSSFAAGKSAVVAAGLGVAAYAAYKVIQNSRKPGDVTH